jgi:hypothetical protein
VPAALEQAHFDWVCVTDPMLIEAYEPLAAHRAGEGLATLVLGLDEVLRWSPVAPDTMGSLRWLAGVTAHQWQAEYLLLGGSHARLPAPIHRLVSPGWTYDFPTDAYYACLDGEWDADGDGLVAEYGEDAADPTVHLAVGRLPLDTADEVAAAIAKIIAYETRPVAATDGALFVSSLMDPYWDGTGVYPNMQLSIAIAMRDTALAVRPSLRAGTLFQGPEFVDPYGDILNPVSLVDSLGARPHDFVYIQLVGNASAWELAGTLRVHREDFAGLAGAGHGFLVTMLSGSVADTRQPSILAYLLGLPDGGAVGGAALTGVGYLFPLRVYLQELWKHLLDGSAVRLGNAHRGALAAFLAEVPTAGPLLTTYWYLSLVGDPALRLRPALAGVAPDAKPDLALRAAPNPFNPATVIRFIVPGPGAAAPHVRLAVYDLRGRVVADLCDGPLAAGPQAIPWRATCPSGLYFARLTVAGAAAVTKLVLIR